MNLVAITTAVALSFAATAFAEPPPGSDPNSPLAKWYRSLDQPANGTMHGGSCCSEADCRLVNYHVQGDHYEVFIDRKTFGPSAPDKWLAVPSTNILMRDNPTGDGVACYYNDQVLCFVPGPQG